MARHKFTTRTLILAISTLAVSFGLLKANTSVHSPTLGIAGFCCLGASLGWPIGHLIGGRQGAIVGSIGGVFVLSFVLAAYVANIVW